MDQPSKHVRQRERLLVAAEDLWEVREFIKAYQEPESTPFHSAITTAIVVTYARSFVKTKKSGLLGYAPLDRPLATYPQTDWQQQHDWFINLRHGAIAHNSREIRRVHVEGGLGHSTYRPGVERLEMLDAMCVFMIDRIVERYHRILEVEKEEPHRSLGLSEMGGPEMPPMVRVGELRPVSEIEREAKLMQQFSEGLAAGRDFREVAQQLGIRVF